MARKSFTQNPALQFIDAGDAEEQQEQAPPTPPTPKQQGGTMPPAQEQPTMHAPLASARAGRQLIAPGYERLAVFDGIGPTHRETKSARLNLVLQPRLKAAIDAAAKSVQLSSNEFIAQILKRELKAGGFLDE